MPYIRPSEFDDYYNPDAQTGYADYTTEGEGWNEFPADYTETEATCTGHGQAA